MPKGDLRERLDQLAAELAELKKALFLTSAPKKRPRRETAEELAELSRQISRRWQGPSALEEIRQQRQR